MTLRLFYTDHHVLPLPAGHRFPIEKYRILRELLEHDGVFWMEPAPLANVKTIELVHDASYVDAFMRGTLDASAMRRIGFPWSDGLVKRTLASVGATLAATREALAKGWSGTLAGGTHHAFAAEGSGYCVFNDIAVATRWVMGAESAREQALGGADAGVRREASSADESAEAFTSEANEDARGYARGRIERVAVVDLDVHQGDGTAEIFRQDSSVLTVSVHCKANFPLRKQRSSIDVELDAGVGDEEYLHALETLLPRVWEFGPELVFYQSGVDGLVSDRLGRLRLSHAGLMERDRMVMRGVRDLGVPLVITLGGGYSDPIALTAEAHANTFRVARDVFGEGKPRR